MDRLVGEGVKERGIRAGTIIHGSRGRSRDGRQGVQIVKIAVHIVCSWLCV